ncbi:unnamed protein product [Arctogadus glacialis]
MHNGSASTQTGPETSPRAEEPGPPRGGSQPLALHPDLTSWLSRCIVDYAVGESRSGRSTWCATGSGSRARWGEEHPKRLITGLASTKSEVSGARFWGLFRQLCGEPELFFRHCFVHNLCPLMFMAESGKNLTPPELAVGERNDLLALCDAALCQAVRALGVTMVIGVGRVAEHRARKALAAAGMGDIRVEGIMHPSPRNPQANKGWADCYGYAGGTGCPCSFEERVTLGQVYLQ